MSKKTLFVIFIIIFTITLSVVAWFIFTDKKTDPVNNEHVNNEHVFGQGDYIKDDPNYNNNGQNVLLTEGTVPVLYQLHTSAVAGLIPLTKTIDEENIGFIRYIERGLGHIYQTNTSDLKKVRLSNETINGIYDAIFSTDGEYVVFRSFIEDTKTIKTYSVKIPNTPESNLEEGVYLPDNIISLQTNLHRPDSLFYLYKTNRVYGVISDFKNEKTSYVFSSPFLSWTTAWVEKDTIALQTKPSFNVPGSLYLLNTKNKELKNIFNKKEGLTTLTNPAISKILYSKKTNKDINTYLYGVISKKTADLPITTLPEKCVWSSSGLILYCAVPEQTQQGLLPDDWYKGVISFNDSIWKIDIETQEIQHLFILNTPTGDGIDATKLALNKEENKLFFINKKDNTPWMLSLD